MRLSAHLGEECPIMKVVIRLSKREELKALPILLRHSPGMVLKDHTYVNSVEAARALRAAGVKLTELIRETIPPNLVWRRAQGPGSE